MRSKAFSRLAGDSYPGLPGTYESPNGYLQAFRALSRPGMPILSAIDGYTVNLAFLRIRMKDGKDVAGSIVINRWHDNVAFKFGEKSALDSSKDSAEFIPGLIGSYPNYFFDVREEELADFFATGRPAEPQQVRQLRPAPRAAHRSRNSAVPV